MRTTLSRRVAAVSIAGFLTVGGAAGLAACSDEDGDGGTTDEEIQDGKDTVDSIEGEIQEEIDSQDQGTNEDGE
jgi:hypothetical protein